MTTIIVSSGVVSSGLTLNNPQQLVVLGGGEADAITLSGGQEFISSGGIASGTSISGPDGGQVISSGGVASATTVSRGGIEVSAGGLSVSAVIKGGGGEFVDGTALGTVVSAGGNEFVAIGGVASGTIVKSGGSETVGTAGLASGTQVLFGGTEILWSGGTEIGASVASGGKLILDRTQIRATLTIGTRATPVTVSGVRLATGAFLGLSSATINSGAIVNVASGGSALATLIDSAGREVVLAGGLASSTVTDTAGVLQVGSSAVASSTTVAFGGTETIQSGGTAFGTVISGGVEFDYGLAVSTVVSSGVEKVENHGVTSGALIQSGGEEIVFSGGLASEVKALTGTLIISSGGALRTGTAGGGLNISGGRLEVATGAVVTGKIVIESGEADIGIAMTSSQTIKFAGSTGVLAIGHNVSLGAKIAGFQTSGQEIDLKGFAFSSAESATWTPLGTSGTLTIRDGAKVEKLTLIGSYVAGEFQLAADGSGGTFITDPPAGAQARFVQAAASLDGGRHDGAAAVHSGGSAATSAAPLYAAAISGRTG